MPACVFIRRCRGFWGRRLCVSTGKDGMKVWRTPQVVELGERGELGVGASQVLALSDRQSHPVSLLPPWPPGAESCSRIHWGNKKAESL